MLLVSVFMLCFMTGAPFFRSPTFLPLSTILQRSSIDIARVVGVSGWVLQLNGLLSVLLVTAAAPEGLCCVHSSCGDQPEPVQCASHMRRTDAYPPTAILNGSRQLQFCSLDDVACTPGHSVWSV
jgi:hypothetical protein